MCACLLLGGCAGGQDYTYEPNNELKPGPGLLSGEDGAFTLLKMRRQEPPEPAESASEKQDTGQR